MSKTTTKDRPAARLISVDDFAAMAGGISRSTANKLFASGRVATVKIGGRRFIPTAEAERVLREGTGA